MPRWRLDTLSSTLMRGLFRSQSVKRSKTTATRIADARTALTALEASISSPSFSTPSLSMLTISTTSTASSSSTATTDEQEGSSCGSGEAVMMTGTTVEDIRSIISLVRTRLNRLVADMNQTSSQRAPPPAAEQAKAVFDARLRHIELMIYLIQTRGSRGARFWKDVTAWQQATHREIFHRISTSFSTILKSLPTSTLTSSSSTQSELLSLQNTFKTISSNAYKEQTIYDGTFYNSFQIRNAFDDRAIREFETSNEGVRAVLRKMEEIHLMEQPAFPPECYELMRRANA